ncbi:hypothetical protein [Paenibacillus sp. tmac-D7]|uniref:hypothetical protein n=1 Tax=Paenibacillus sp. tmac-D7 TaxID=2591462 RepID=UPI0011443524|nr:hypothetical protein [Paenibacillus sp. tmac-D7]
MALKLLSVVFIVIGISILFMSPTWGADAALSYLQNVGGMEPARLIALQDSYCASFRTAGAILLSAGIIRLLFWNLPGHPKQDMT